MMLLDDVHVHDSNNHDNTNLGDCQDNAMGHSMSQVDPTYKNTMTPRIPTQQDTYASE